MNEESQENQIQLLKRSPLAAFQRKLKAKTVMIQGWEVVEYCSSEEMEKQYLAEQCLLVDWSHLGKISLSRGAASDQAEKAVKGAAQVGVLGTITNRDSVALRLTRNDYLILCPPQSLGKYLNKISRRQTIMIDQSGALGCLVLAGPRRDEVLERSTAADLRRDRLAPGSVLQTTVHTISCTIYRTESLELLVHPRVLSESLFDALMDVGEGVGLLPGGIGTVPVNLSEGTA